MKSIKFGQRIIGREHPALIIAEIGINHEGSVETCAKMIEEAAKSGADSIKLQTLDPDRNYAPGTISHELFSRAVLTPEETAQMFAFTRELGMEPFTTAGDFKTLEWLSKLNPSGYKISSGLLSCSPVIRKVASYGQPLLLSTGMADESNITIALDVAKNAGARDIGLFQCTSLYPAPENTLNLRSIQWLQNKFSVPTGFSDHSIGIEAPVYAVAAGAVMVEKHFTLDRTRPEFDHRLSLEPKDFLKMVGEIRRAELMLGFNSKPLTNEAAETRDQMSRYLGAIKDIPAYSTLNEENTAFLRFPKGQGGLNANQYDKVIGKKNCKPIKAYTPIKQDHLLND